MIRELTEAFSALDMVKAVALSGSMTSAIHDSDSDYDIYIYSDSRVPIEERKRILGSLMADYAVDISPFEEGDEAHDASGRGYDLMYRSLEWTEWQMDEVWRKHNARIGYTTCFIYNIRTSDIIFDRDGWLSELRKEAEGSYPEELRERIIRKNMDIVDGNGMSTFLIQAELAFKRGDAVSMNHRLSAILASIFDAVFAYSRVLHPGEKKLLGYAELLCPSLPEDFTEKVRNAIASIGDDSFINSLKDLISSVEAWLGYESGE